MGDWGTVLGDQVVATAILDRLLHHSHVLTIRGDSYRLREKRRSGLIKATSASGIRLKRHSSGGGWVLSVAPGWVPDVACYKAGNFAKVHG